MTVLVIQAREAEPANELEPLPGGRFVYENVSWAYYTQTLRELERCGQHARVTYDRGRMEIMTVSRRHEVVKKVIGRRIEAYVYEAVPGVEGVCNVTCRRETLERGLEPDECY